ncbi:MAG: leucine-rich repeat protein [Clostridia bacterium]|nr:leucine-rich repeat protein [Clostridia bacterium]
MKKILFALVVLFALLFAVSAYADRYPTNPYRAEDLRLEQLDWKRQHMLRSYLVMDFRLDITTAPSYDTQGVVEIVPLKDGILDDYSYMAQLYVEALGSENRLIYSFRDIQSTTITLPSLVMPAEYRLALFCTNKDGSGDDRSASCTFTLEPDASHPSLDDKLAGIVNECRVAGDDWQTALNIHDWLTHHAYYDGTYSNYGPDGVLYRGTGVCDSYSKAYLLLLNKAGISAERLSCPAMNHAWNLVCFDGNWTHVDVTWDDPFDDSTNAVTGFEGHHYFAISDDFIQDSKYGHDIHENYSANHACTSMAYSAILRLHEEGWPIADHWMDDDDNTGTYTDLIQAELNQCHPEFEIALYDRLDFGDGYSADASDFTIEFYLYALAQQWVVNWTDDENTPLHLTFTYNPDPGAGVFRVSAEPSLPETGTLLLPDDLETLESEAFAGVAASTVVIPTSCHSIGAQAFAGTGVHTAHIPASVTEIDDSAFLNCKWVTICGAEGSKAEEFALAHGFRFIVE